MRLNTLTDTSAQLSSLALMRKSRIYGQTERVREFHKSEKCRTSVCICVTDLRWARGFGSHASEAPRPETPCRENICRTSRGVARPGQPRHHGRCHACSRAWPQTGGILLRPRTGEGRNNVLKKCWCASPVSDSVHDRDGSSGRIEEQNRTDRE